MTMPDITSDARRIRTGRCYELISDILQRHFNFECPPAPAMEVLPHGHLQEPGASAP
jgi:hypothetical protein